MSPGRSITLSVYDFNMTTASGTPRPIPWQAEEQLHSRFSRGAQVGMTPKHLQSSRHEHVTPLLQKLPCRLQTAVVAVRTIERSSGV